MSAMIAKVTMIVVVYHPVIQASNSDVSGGDIEAFDDNAIYYAIVYEYVPSKSEVTCTSFQKSISNFIAVTTNIVKAVHQTVSSNMLLNYMNKYLIL